MESVQIYESIDQLKRDLKKLWADFDRAVDQGNIIAAQEITQRIRSLEEKLEKRKKRIADKKRTPVHV